MTGGKPMINILVVEDDKALNQLVASSLKMENYSVVACFNGQEALKEMENQPFDMLIADVMMPEMDGFTLAKRVRESDRRLPILFMTALDDKPSMQKGFDIGIDDYLVKPFDVEILLMRVKALLRRANIERSREIVVGDFRMNKDEHTAYIGGEELSLTVREFDILFKLLSFPKRTFTRAQLMEEFWGYDSSANSRTVDVLMVKLREKTMACASFEILTVRGLGYKAVLK